MSDILYFAQIDAQSSFDTACRLRDYARERGESEAYIAGLQAVVSEKYDALIASQSAYYEHHTRISA